MGRKVKKEVYIVFQGRKPGLYYTWDECQKQVNGFSGAKFQGYTNRQKAERAWNDYEQTPRWSPEASVLATVLGNAHHLQSPLDTNSLAPSKRARTTEAIELPELNGGSERPNTYEYIVITSDDEKQPRGKKPKKVANFFRDDVAFIPYDEVEGELDLDRKESSFELTAAQEAVVEMAMNGDNIFLTGAAGSGKTATLKEILRRLQKKHLEEGSKGYKEHPEDTGNNFPCVQVVAPTGIAALPLNGKTTYSFAGWYVGCFLAMWFFVRTLVSPDYSLDC
jgi:Caulimovirus viroplasmin/AAA domain